MRAGTTLTFQSFTIEGDSQIEEYDEDDEPIEFV
jgi:hypothetical protein